VLISWIGAGRDHWVQPQISVRNGILIVAAAAVYSSGSTAAPDDRRARVTRFELIGI
jgi:hypothetical protein